MASFECVSQRLDSRSKLLLRETQNIECEIKRWGKVLQHNSETHQHQQQLGENHEKLMSWSWFSRWIDIAMLLIWPRKIISGQTSLVLGTIEGRNVSQHLLSWKKCLPGKISVISDDGLLSIGNNKTCLSWQWLGILTNWKMI